MDIKEENYRRRIQLSWETHKSDYSGDVTIYYSRLWSKLHNISTKSNVNMAICVATGLLATPVRWLTTPMATPANTTPNIGILATPLAVSASPWQPKEKMLATPLNMVNSKLRNSYSAY